MGRPLKDLQTLTEAVRKQKLMNAFRTATIFHVLYKQLPAQMNKGDRSFKKSRNIYLVFWNLSIFFKACKMYTLHDITNQGFMFMQRSGTNCQLNINKLEAIPSINLLLKPLCLFDCL